VGSGRRETRRPPTTPPTRKETENKSKNQDSMPSRPSTRRHQAPRFRTSSRDRLCRSVVKCRHPQPSPPMPLTNQPTQESVGISSNKGAGIQGEARLARSPTPGSTRRGVVKSWFRSSSVRPSFWGRRRRRRGSSPSNVRSLFRSPLLYCRVLLLSKVRVRPSPSNAGRKRA